MHETNQSLLKVEKLKQLFTVLAEEHGFNGCILVGDEGEIIYKHAFGLANFETKEPLTVDSVFELASVSKTFTATAIMLLQEQGKLSYDDTITRFLPALPYQHITVKHLLNHTSGLPPYESLFLQYWDQTKIANNDDVIELLIKYKPAVLFQPNEKWEYSNTGYVLLASIIESVSGMSYAEFLQKHIFQPLQMKRTTVFNRRYTSRTIPNYAYGYVYSYEQQKYVLPDELDATNYVYYLDGIQGDGTVNSTVEDLWKWDRALYTEQLVTRQTLEEAFRQTVLHDGSEFPYGYGWAIGDHEEVGKLVNHSGGWPGYETLLSRYISKDKTIVFLSNKPQTEAWFEENIVAIENILFDRDFSMPKPPKRKEKVAINPEVYKKYVGVYRLPQGEAIEIVTDEDDLLLKATSQQLIELLPLSETRFFIREADMEIEFIVQGDGEVSEFLIDEGEISRAIRV